MQDNLNSDEGLDAQVRAARPQVALPPGFAQGVWRRVEQAELAAQVGTAWPRLEHLADLLIRPRLAMAGMAALILVSASAGLVTGTTAARHEALARYVATVVPTLEP